MDRLGLEIFIGLGQIPTLIDFIPFLWRLKRYPYAATKEFLLTSSNPNIKSSFYSALIVSLHISFLKFLFLFHYVLSLYLCLCTLSTSSFPFFLPYIYLLPISPLCLCSLSTSFHFFHLSPSLSLLSVCVLFQSHDLPFISLSLPCVSIILIWSIFLFLSLLSVAVIFLCVHLSLFLYITVGRYSFIPHYLSPSSSWPI